jgi:hypothetical protein
MSANSQAERAAMSIEQDFRHSITALATDTCEACGRTINGTGFENMSAEQVVRLRLAVELAGQDQAMVFRDTHKVFDSPHIFWAYFSLFKAASVSFIEVAYDSLAKIEGAQPELPDGWALERCAEQCKKVSKEVALWTQNATHPYAGVPWLAPSYLWGLPINGVWGAFKFSQPRLDEAGTGIVIGQLQTVFNLRLMNAANDRYKRDLVAAAQEAAPKSAEPKTKPGKTKTSREQRDPVAAKRAKVIREISKAGYTGPQYCEQLDRRGVEPLSTWREWPGKYVTAYKLNGTKGVKWRKKITDEKNRHSK